jgi:AcrR family transcriptional regulator
MKRTTAEPAAATARLKREEKQRAGLCEATVRVVAERGFGATKSYIVLQESGFGAKTFYKFFPDLEACFTAALETYAAATFEQVRSAGAERSDPQARIEAGIASLTELLAGNPAVAQVLLVEARAARMPSRVTQQRWLRRFEALLESAFPGPAQYPSGAARMAVGAVSTLLALEVAAGRTRELPGMQADLVEAALTSFSSPRR